MAADCGLPSASKALAAGGPYLTVTLSLCVSCHAIDQDGNSSRRPVDGDWSVLDTRCIEALTQQLEQAFFGGLDESGREFFYTDLKQKGFHDDARPNRGYPSSSLFFT